MGGGRLTIPSMGACRVKAKLPMPPLDNTRFRLEPPSLLKRNDYGEWKKAVDNAHSQLEHQYTRILNLELMLKYGDKVRGGGSRRTPVCVKLLCCTWICICFQLLTSTLALTVSGVESTDPAG